MRFWVLYIIIHIYYIVQLLNYYKGFFFSLAVLNLGEKYKSLKKDAVKCLRERNPYIWAGVGTILVRSITVPFRNLWKRSVMSLERNWDQKYRWEGTGRLLSWVIRQEFINELEGRTVYRQWISNK